MKNVGIFSGSFNPVHIGHLALANWLCEYENLSEIWFLVTPQNPLKEGCRMLGFQTRYEMVEAAIAGYPRFRVSDFELSLPQPSYTIRTLCALRRTYPECLFHLVIGADNWENIEQWKDAAALVEEFPVLIYPRAGYDRPAPPPPTNVRRVDAPALEISSSFIRDAIRQGRDIRFFLPESVREKAVSYFMNPLNGNL
ncbi:MAG: nicotinate-nucleotide adenylyltransferase [Tannerella sp.]|jgi:nicotinate-nucleotide adenylyltransferase|nr:nicotinate-nucleotide adenylyltransferase [Tannerella sp.]